MHRPPLTGRQLIVLRWVADGCASGVWPDESHKNTARALASRGLLDVRHRNKSWQATLTEAGQYYLDHNEYPPPLSPMPKASAASPAKSDTLARRAVRGATSPRERRSFQRARRRNARPGTVSDHLKDIPMRYKIVVSRVQTAERHVRATTEDDAMRKVQQELERPYGFLGGWTTIATDLDIVAAESPLDGASRVQINEADGGFLLSIKAAAKYLGISYSTLYDLINRGEINHVLIGSRRYVSREHLNAFIEANTHSGYQR